MTEWVGLLFSQAQLVMATNTDEWCKIEDSNIPAFTIANITNYFIKRVSVDGKPANDFKNINTRAYPLFKAGHIQSIYIRHQDNSYDIKCICLPEMKKDILYKMDLTMNSCGDVTSASCACPAGAGPFGSCKHIAALCYALEEFCRLKEVRPPDSCTSHLQQWNRPRKRHLDARDVSGINFIKHEFGKVKRTLSSVLYDPRPSEYTVTSGQEVEMLSQKLAATGKNIALRHLLPVQIPAVPAPQDLPPAPPLSRDKAVTSLSNQQQPLHCSSISEACTTFLTSLKYSPGEVAAVECATRQQRLCRRWQEERQYRLTASRFGAVVKRQRNHDTLAKQLLYSSVHSSGVSALMWGQQHEDDALEAYKRTLPSHLSLHGVGFFVSSCGFLGASPDGVVKDNSDSVRLVEVKCPYKARERNIEEMLDDPSFCCERENGQIRLKRKHDYYFQVQGQMSITGIHQCDFVVWTPLDLFITRIEYDPLFWSTQCYQKLKSFYFNFVLPEIVYPKHPHSPTDYTDVHLYT